MLSINADLTPQDRTGAILQSALRFLGKRLPGLRCLGSTERWYILDQIVCCHFLSKCSEQPRNSPNGVCCPDFVTATGERARGTPVACFQQIVWCIQVTGKLGLRVISLQSHQLICNQAIRCTGKQDCPAFADADCYRPWTNFSVHEAVLCCENALRCSN